MRCGSFIWSEINLHLKAHFRVAHSLLFKTEAKGCLLFDMTTLLHLGFITKFQSKQCAMQSEIIIVCIKLFKVWIMECRVHEL